MSDGEYVSEEKLIVLCELYDGTHGPLFVKAQSYLNLMRNDPVVAYLTLKGTQHKGKVSLEQLFFEADEQNTPKVNYNNGITVQSRKYAHSFLPKV